MTPVFSNNASSTLASAISASATSLTLASASAFPALQTGEFFFLTLVGYDTAGNENS